MDGSILIEQKKQRVRRWRFNMVFPDGDFFLSSIMERSVDS